MNRFRKPKFSFDHEKLNVYQESIIFAAWANDLLDKLPKSLSAHDQLDRASTSIPLNIAEGNGKHTAPDRCRYFDHSRGSALECAACLDVLVARKRISQEQSEAGKAILNSIVSILVGLVRTTSPDRVHEEQIPYRVRDADSNIADRLAALEADNSFLRKELDDIRQHSRL